MSIFNKNKSQISVCLAIAVIFIILLGYPAEQTPSSSTTNIPNTSLKIGETVTMEVDLPAHKTLVGVYKVADPQIITGLPVDAMPKAVIKEHDLITELVFRDQYNNQYLRLQQELRIKSFVEIRIDSAQDPNKSIVSITAKDNVDFLVAVQERNMSGNSIVHTKNATEVYMKQPFNTHYAYSRTFGSELIKSLMLIDVFDYPYPVTPDLSCELVIDYVSGSCSCGWKFDAECLCPKEQVDSSDYSCDVLPTPTPTPLSTPTRTKTPTSTPTPTLKPPVIISQPTARQVAVGQPAVFSVEATGENLSYQWRKNGFNITVDGKSQNYLIIATTLEDSGSLYSVVVSNSAGSITSKSASLSVYDFPTITTQPVAQTVTAGQSARFSVVATGGNLRYQWRDHGFDIPGAYSTSYTIPITTLLDSHSDYSVVVSNPLGSVTSSTATLIVNAPPAIKTQPRGISVTAGQTATFSVVATGGSLTYKWRKNGAVINGAVSATYTTSATTLTDSGSQYSVEVTNSLGSVTSNNATLIVNPLPPAITTQPASRTVTAGTAATFSVVTTGERLSYQWRKNGANIVTGGTSSSYTTPATTLSNSGSQYSVVVSNIGGSVTSSSALLTVNAPPAIQTQPRGISVTAGQTATFSVVATGGNLRYQWRKNGVAISGATSSSYTTPRARLADSGSLYSVVVTNTLGFTTSHSVALTVEASPVVTTNPLSQTITVGRTATFSVVATGGNLRYQWRKNGVAISGATSSSYTTPAARLADSRSLYSVVVTNTLGSTTSIDAYLIVNSK